MSWKYIFVMLCVLYIKTTDRENCIFNMFYLFVVIIYFGCYTLLV